MKKVNVYIDPLWNYIDVKVLKTAGIDRVNIPSYALEMATLMANDKARITTSPLKTLDIYACSLATGTIRIYNFEEVAEYGDSYVVHFKQAKKR